MSIFKESFPKHINKQLQIRQEILATQYSGSLGRIGNPSIKIDVSKTEASNEFESVNLPPGAFYTNTVQKQCVIKMSSGVDLKDSNTVLEGAPWEDSNMN